MNRGRMIYFRRRLRTEAALSKARIELEKRVAERTNELTVANMALRAEITERLQVEKALRSSEARLTEYSQRLKLLHDMDRIILSAPSSTELAQAALRLIRQLVPCQRASVVVFDYINEEARYLAVDSVIDTRLGPGFRLPIDSREVHRLYQEKPFLVAEDFHIEKNGVASSKGGYQVAEKLINEGLCNFISIPLITQSELIGCLTIGRDQPGDLEPEHRDYIRHLADSLAVALQNVQLFEQVRVSQKQLQNLSHQLVEVQETERRYIARELHDEASQSLTSLMVGLRLLQEDLDYSDAAQKHIADLKSIADNILENLHRLASDLRPASLDHLGLLPALRQFLDSFGERYNLPVQFEAIGLEGIRLPAEAEISLYRIIQEALTNVGRHAHATWVAVVLELRKDRIIAIVEDNGVGFDPNEVQQGERLGILGMYERADMFGWSLYFETQKGAGTTLFVEIPYKI